MGEAQGDGNSNSPLKRLQKDLGIVTNTLYTRQDNVKGVESSILGYCQGLFNKREYK